MLKKVFVCFVVLFVFFNPEFSLLFSENESQNDEYNWNSSYFEDSKNKDSGDSDNQKKVNKSFSFDLFDFCLVYSSLNFDIYYYNEDKVRHVISNIEEVYSLIISDLNYVFFYNPKRINIYIYRTREEYLRKTGMTGWASGHSNVKKNAIYTFEQKNLLENIVGHELTHLVFDNYMGYPRSRNVTWLHEGLAVYEEKRCFNKVWDLGALKKAIEAGEIGDLKAAMQANLGLNDSKKVAAWYLEMGSLICYLFTLDREGFKVFCENVKIYKNIDDALRFTYPWNFHNIKELEIKWKEWLETQKNFF